MFEAKCPSCSATYQVDERRVPPQGLKMRCPKCGESFQVSSPQLSEPPVLGAALGLGKGAPPRPRHKATMLGMPDQKDGPPAPRPGLPRAGTKKTMIGVAPAGLGDGLELASLDDEVESVSDEDELDLSAPDAGVEADLSGGIDELDLSGPDSDGLGLDLPTPSSRRRSGVGQIDLPGDLPDLPRTPRSSGDVDLPGIAAGLPSPVSEAGLPDLAADLPDLGGSDLPDLGAGLPDLETGLPIVGGNLPTPGGNLPSRGGNLPSRGGNLPSPGGSLPTPGGNLPTRGGVLGGVDPFGSDDDSAFGTDEEFDLGSSHDGLDLSGPPPPRRSVPPEQSADDIFGQGPTHAPKSVHPPKPIAGDPSAFGEVNLGGDAGGGAGLEDDDEFDAFPTDDSGGASDAGGAGYGDVSLDGGAGGGGGLDLGDDVVRPPQGDEPAFAGRAAATARVELPQPGSKSKKEKAEKKKRRKTSSFSKGTRVALGAAILLAIGGGALSLLPDIGPYGAYWILDQVKAEDHRASLEGDIAQATQLLDADTADDVSRAFMILETGIGQAPRYKARAAYTAFVGYLHQLRFGAASTESARAQVLLDGVVEAAPDAPHVELAQLARKAADGDATEAAANADRKIAQGLEFAVIVGEAALQIDKVDVAQKAWNAVLAKGPTPRAHFGLARTFQLAGKDDEARKHLDATLKLNPNHAGARLLLARLQLRDRMNDQEIVKSLTPLAAGKGSSEGERVQALVLLGDLHLSRSRLKKAEESFTEALRLDAGSAAAQRGLAQTLFDSGRFSEALARFEAAHQKAPNSLEVNIGLVQCKLRLEQLDDAVKLLAKLNQSHPESTAVSYWVGRGKEAVGEKDAAQKAYEAAIKFNEDVPELVGAYISLTRLLSQKGNLEEADVVIGKAEKRFPDDPAVYEALGELSSSRGSFDDAVADYDRALQLDPTNIGLRFARGIALRQARRFKDAEAEFDRVEKESADYPGLALERGNLYEASDRKEEALKAYEQALAAAPDDLDLMLRVACGKAGAGQSEEALKLLDPVLEKRANSAEANFCNGLAILNGGKDFNQAKIFLVRAVSRDPTRAKYHLYVGWVSMELGDLSQASVSLDKTIELDRTLADAYWKRGELRVKNGAVVDALTDLNRALELAPSRLEAHAAMARAYEQIGKEQEALAAWEKAVTAEVVEPVWHYQYGELLYVNQKEDEAREQLEKAVNLGEKEEPKPVWLADAHRYYAMSLGRGKPALEHWKAYLDLKTDPNDPYRREALKELDAILKMSGH